MRGRDSDSVSFAHTRCLTNVSGWWDSEEHNNTFMGAHKHEPQCSIYFKIAARDAVVRCKTGRSS